MGESNQVDSPRITEEMREKTAHLTFLIHSYEPQMCWFEVFESMRRLMLSSMLILIDPGSSAQIVAAILICLVSIKFYSFYLPFVEDSDDVLAEAAQWQTFCVFFSALLIRVDATGESPSSQMLLSMLLIVIVTSGSLLMSGIILYEIFIENDEEDTDEDYDDDSSDPWETGSTKVLEAYSSMVKERGTEEMGFSPSISGAPIQLSRYEASLGEVVSYEIEKDAVAGDLQSTKDMRKKAKSNEASKLSGKALESRTPEVADETNFLSPSGFLAMTKNKLNSFLNVKDEEEEETKISPPPLPTHEMTTEQLAAALVLAREKAALARKAVEEKTAEVKALEERHR